MVTIGHGCCFTIDLWVAHHEAHKVSVGVVIVIGDAIIVERCHHLIILLDRMLHVRFLRYIQSPST